MTIHEQFQQATEDVKKISSRPDNETLLSLYGLYKQATEGDAKGSKPSLFDLKGRKKFEAWERRKGMPSPTAMEKYIALVKSLS